MILLVKFIGILMIAMGAVNVLSPVMMRNMLAFWSRGKNVYAGGLLRLLLGLVFLWSAPQSKSPVIIYALGILMLLGGVFIFALRLDKIKSMLDWWNKKSDSILRLTAILILGIGALIFYSA